MRSRCCVIAPGHGLVPRPNCCSKVGPFVVSNRGPAVFEVVPTKPIGATPRNLGTMPAIKARPEVELDFDAEVARFLEALADVEALDGVVQHAM